MQNLLIIVTIGLAVCLIVLVILLPRENQTFSNDTTGNIGKSGYWQIQSFLKFLTLSVSLALFLCLLLFLMLSD